MSPALLPFVSEIAVNNGPASSIRRLPDGGVSLIFRGYGDKADLHVLGPSRSVRYKAASDYSAFIRVSFFPGGALPFFGVPLSELTDQVIALESLWGHQAVTLCDAVATAPADRVRIQRLERALLRHFRPNATQDSAVQRAACLLRDPHQPISAVARNTGVTERSFRRKFLADIGLSPKRYARIMRFRYSIQQVSTDSPGWADIAASCGYFDQAHLSSEFRDLTGLTPVQFARGDRPKAMERCTS